MTPGSAGGSSVIDRTEIGPAAVSKLINVTGPRPTVFCDHACVNSGESASASRSSSIRGSAP